MAFSGTDSSIFCLKSLLTCGDIQLSSWCQNGRTQILALYLSRGELVICLLTDKIPVIRRLPWYRDAVHQPVALALSPAGSFLLVLSQSCHLYTVPALPLLDPTYKTDMALNATEITLISYPFKKDPYIDTFCNLKQLSGTKPEKIASALTWYQTLEDCQQIGIIGTDNGELILVDLVQAVKIASVSVRGTVLNLTVCHDNSLESVFLLVTTSVQQYKLILEQRPISSKDHSRGGSSEEAEDEPPKNYRARLHGLKQMSVEKFASIKMKIAETRAKAHLKSVVEDTKSFLHPVPEPLDSSIRGTLVSLQYSRGRYALSDYHQQTQFLTEHSTHLEKNPLFVYKMPPDTVECLLSDRIIYVVNQDRTQVSAVSSHLSESRIERDSEFNPECVLGTFDVNNSFLPIGEAFQETVIAIYQGFAASVPFNCPDDWKVDGLQKLLNEGGMTESCIVVTTRKVFRLGLTNHVVYSVLQLILEHHALLLAERLCKIFGLNLSKILELAGDIDMARLKFPAAIAHFKLASCGPLRITVKLAKLGHCTELLSYSSALLATPAANLSLTDNIHISNLVLMSFAYQILNGGGAHFRRRFLSFLASNDYYDKCLGMNVVGQSLLFSAVHKLVTQRGLIVDGLSVLGVLVNNFNHDRDLEAAAEDEDMWLCLTEPMLQEAFVPCRATFLLLSTFLNRHLTEMSDNVLNRVCKLFDPSTAVFRPLVRLIPMPDDEESFPLDKLVHLFLTILFVQMSKTRMDYDKNLMLPFEVVTKEDSPPRLTESFESSDETIWAIRKEKRDSCLEYSEGRVLSCGFGHTALIRNGNVMTWGMSIKGCLGHGPGLLRSALPEAIAWFSNFRLQVSQVSCGRTHSMALTNNGLYAWGSSHFGQLGLKGVSESPHPRLVVALTKYRITSVVCGQYHTLCLTSNGSLLGFGWNVHGQLGIGTVENVTEPVLIHTLKQHVIVDVAAGHGHSLVLTNTGHVYSFGSSIFGQLGTGTVHKSSVPVLVKGIPAKVIKIATAYFHNLALTSHNSLYAWGASPQVLRLQSQAHKRARAIKPIGAEVTTADITSSDAHLETSLVDTRNVTGRIAQIACGCHHFALATESGSLYTWGRSMDGQLGNGSRNEVVVPSLIQDGTLKVSALSLGCDFTVVVEKHSGRVFAWGSNGSGQIGVPIKETAAKVTDGKVIIVKSVKRVVRLPNSVANLVDTPCEVPSIPSATFTYQSLNSSCAAPNAFVNESLDNPAVLWHKTVEKFFAAINPDLLLCKCLEMGNHQAASKILLLQGQTRQALVHQLKALQRAQKLRERASDNGRRSENGIRGEKGRRTVQTPDADVHPFTVQGGVEGMCDMVDTHSYNGGEEEVQKSPPRSLDLQLADYANTADEILLRFLIHSPDSAADILETGIQFWTAQKLPMAALENFLLEHIERVYYPLGCLLYLSKRDLNKYFSAELQLRITTRLVTHVEQNGNCDEFLALFSKLLSMDAETTVADLSAKLQNPPKKNIHVTWPQCQGDSVYIFSCGHSRTSLPNGKNKLSEAYAKLDKEGSIDMACPDCVCNVLSTEVA